MTIYYILKVINKENQLSEIGSLVKIDPNKINGKVSDELAHILSINSIGEVIGYKITDGTDMGLIIKLNNGQSAWFFKDEIKSIDSDIGDNFITNRSFYANNKVLTLEKDIKYVLNPIKFLDWLIFSLKDVI